MFLQSLPLFKYPRTPHLEGSRLQDGDDGSDQMPLKKLAGQYVVIEEKIDGANSAVRRLTGASPELFVTDLRDTRSFRNRTAAEFIAVELRTRDRQRKLITKIDAALRRIEEGEYGYCEVTGDPISLARLEARPIATMTLEAQEQHERVERVSRDD